MGEAFFERMKRIADEGGTPLETGAALAVFLGSAASDGITGKLLSAVWDPWAELPAHRDDLDTHRRLHAAPHRRRRTAGWTWADDDAWAWRSSAAA